MNAQNRILRSPIARIVSANISVQTLGLISILLTAAVLTTESFATFTVVMVWAAVLTGIMPLGIPDAMVAQSRTIAQCSGTYRAGLWLLTSAGTVAGILLFFLLWSIFDVSLVASLLAAGRLPLANVSAWVSSLQQRRRNFGAYNRLLVLSGLIVLLGTVVPLIVDKLATLEYVLAVRTVGLAVPVALGLWLTRSAIGLPPALQLVRVLQYGISYHWTALLNILGGRADQMIATLFLSVAAMSQLGMLLPFATATKSLAHATSTVGLVDVVEARTRAAQRLRIRILTQKGFGAALAWAFVLTFVLLAATQAALGLGLSVPLFDLGDLVAVSVFLLAAAGSSIVDLMIRLQRAVGEYAIGIASRCGAIVVAVPLGFVLVPSLGLSGVSLTALSATVASFAIIAPSVLRRRSDEQ